MAAKKFYAVKKGKTTGIFSNWDDCKASVDGFPGASYKGFATLEEAKAFMGEENVVLVGEGKPAKGESSGAEQSGIGSSVERRNAFHGEMASDMHHLLAYVDGSYEDSIKKYAFGCVFILPNGKIYTEYGNGDNPQSLQHRNVTGEMLGAMYAVRFAMANGFRSIEIRYDYEGIEKWVTGAWRSKTELTQKYAAAMRDWSNKIAIKFTKVAAHTNEEFNELADKMAKTGLTEGNGVPKVKLLADMIPYDGSSGM